ncbi:helix-turn-helix domain-containing protein [Rhodococcus artemisiae]|uniref:Helix-turn-helix domain-containing protein n=1 Tax=Rhodococcus artemisiae TaxID=714159 RepID=A0ABU7LFT6_9NOCA|nr:helix-turn-helix domain-containing protein [Rhodococcus artemisiae]MEE2060398.1 helix-turn-helix domain-containing protein [Rhodococcus artemisiae]
MSIEAITWTLKHAAIPSPTPPGMPSAPALTLVLLGLANHASRQGKSAFPSVRTLAGYARMSERQVQRCLSALVELEIIAHGDQKTVAATISREDRRPTCYNIRMSQGGNRSSSAGCPELRRSGRSRVEVAHHAAAIEVFGNARSGITMTDEAFTSRRSWTTDISVDHQGATLVIEYDGVYWHRRDAKILVDQRKSLDLLSAGCVVVRLREDDLPTLEIEDPWYREIRVRSAAPRPRRVMEDIRRWIEDLPTG